MQQRFLRCTDIMDFERTRNTASEKVCLSVAYVQITSSQRVVPADGADLRMDRCRMQLKRIAVQVAVDMERLKKRLVLLVLILRRTGHMDDTHRQRNVI